MFTKSWTLARACVELRDGLRRGEWVGRDRSFAEVHLTLGPRMVPEVHVGHIDGAARWSYRGWRALAIFERLAKGAGRAAGVAELVEPMGLRRAA